MRGGILWVLMGGMILAGAIRSQDVPNTGEFPPIPETIRTFYEDYSFVGSFSTRVERRGLVEHLDGRRPRADLKNRRLIEVLDRMIRIKSRIWRPDPNMIAGGPVYLHLFRSAVARVRKADPAENKIVLEVGVYMLEPGQVSRFISEYNKTRKGEDGISGYGERIGDVEAGGVEQKEFHTWIRMNGDWYKREAQIIQLKR